MLKQAKIYLVEDEAITAMFMKNQLKKTGIEINRIFATGEEAVEAVLEEQPDLLLMDINLAGEIDGIEAIKRINSDYSIPVIFVTGYSNEDVRKRAMELNPADFFIKPVNINELKSAIEAVLKCGV